MGKELTEMPETVTRDGLATLLGVSVRAVTEMAARGVAVRSGRGLYDLRASVQGYCANLREVAAGRGGEAAGLSLTEERARLASFQAEMKALDLAKARGELLEAGAVAREWMGILQKVRAGLLAVPARIQARLRHLTSGDVAEIDAEVRKVLEEIASDE